jgi:hypothetical protein
MTDNPIITIMPRKADRLPVNGTAHISGKMAHQ